MKIVENYGKNMEKLKYKQQNSKTAMLLMGLLHPEGDCSSFGLSLPSPLIMEFGIEERKSEFRVPSHVMNVI